MNKTRVFLSDPQVLFREGMHFVLSGEDDFEVTGEATGNGDAIALIELSPPHVAILSLQDALLDGIEATHRIRRNLPSVAVVLSMNEKGAEEVLGAIRSGASACLPRDAEPDQLIDLIRAIALGGLPAADELLEPGLASIVLSDFQGATALNEKMGNMLATLSPKEARVLNDIAAGSEINQVAGCLNTDDETVRQVLKSVLSKLVANDQVRSVLETAGKNRPPQGQPPAARNNRRDDYVTRAEFESFQTALMADLRLAMGGRPLD
jgi:DNA-binding NarL/FixJ family response regulator